MTLTDQMFILRSTNKLNAVQHEGTYKASVLTTIKYS